MTSSNIFISDSSKKLLVLAEGFESRSLSWISDKQNKLHFNRALICKYRFHSKTNFDKVLSATKQHCSNEPEILEYDRFEPTVFERKIQAIADECRDYNEIIIDISVMSKLLVLIVIYSFIHFNGKLRIVYTEPETWGPTHERYMEALANKEKKYSWVSLSSKGISNVTKTPNLSSIIMQNSPSLLVSFYSFNEQLLGALINEISPSKLQLINHFCNRQKWREEAMVKIHENVIQEFFGESIEETFSAHVLDYIAVFEKLADIYNKHCYNYRIIISPTGGKVHALAVALLKLCCPDVHIEYPTPESYLFEDYTSEKTHAVHQIVFEKFNHFITDLSSKFIINR